MQLGAAITNLPRVALAAALIIGTQTAHTASTSSESRSAIDSVVMTKLAKARTYDRASTNDLLAASVGLDTSPCAVSGVSISPTHCADLAKREILRRRPVQKLLTAVREASIADGKGLQAIHLLEQIKGPEVERGLRRIAETFDTDPGNYLALLHFADMCQTWSLQVLNSHWFGWRIPSFVWAGAVEDFGRCDYRPATTHLISSLDAASLNLVDAADDSLRRMYPNGPKAGVGEVAISAWTAWVRTHSSH
jgi:hypothetical protein